MTVYIITGKLGNGKSLVSVGRIRYKLQKGCTIATNLNLNLVHLLGRHSKLCRVLRVPDKPTARDLYALGNANESYDEENNGLLVLDECGTWFNARNWQDKTRTSLNDWFLHARKLGWDVILIVQDINLIDSQARQAIAEHTVFCKRLDRLQIPFFTTFFKIISLGQFRLTAPRIHVGKVVYGVSEIDPLSDRWVYRGNDLFSAYDTKQAFLSNYEHGLYSMLTPWHVSGRFAVPQDWRFYMRMTKIYWKRFRTPVAAATGLLTGVALTASMAFANLYREASQQPQAKPSPVVAPAAHDPEKKDEKIVLPTEPADPVRDRLKMLRIVAAVEMGERHYMEFTNTPRGAPTGSTLNTEELAKIGVKTIWQNDCHATLIWQKTEYQIYCL